MRCLLLVMCTYPFAKKPLTLHLARGEGRERYFGYNSMQRKVLASSHQHLMAEAPHRTPCGLETALGLTLVKWPRWWGQVKTSCTELVTLETPLIMKLNEPE